MTMEATVAEAVEEVIMLAWKEEIVEEGEEVEVVDVTVEVVVEEEEEGETVEEVEIK